MQHKIMNDLDRIGLDLYAVVKSKLHPIIEGIVFGEHEAIVVNFTDELDSLTLEQRLDLDTYSIVERLLFNEFKLVGCNLPYDQDNDNLYIIIRKASYLTFRPNNTIKCYIEPKYQESMKHLIGIGGRAIDLTIRDLNHNLDIWFNNNILSGTKHINRLKYIKG